MIAPTHGIHAKSEIVTLSHTRKVLLCEDTIEDANDSTDNQKPISKISLIATFQRLGRHDMLIWSSTSIITIWYDVDVESPLRKWRDIDPCRVTCFARKSKRKSPDLAINTFRWRERREFWESYPWGIWWSRKASPNLDHKSWTKLPRTGD
jgi:hypothetical protein